MATTEAPAKTVEFDPSRVVTMGNGLRVVTNMRITGDNLTALEDAPGVLSNIRFMGCDLSGQSWSGQPQAVRFVDCDLTDTQFHFDNGVNVDFVGSKPLHLAQGTSGIELAAGARPNSDITGMRLSGSVSGLLIRQVAGADVSVAGMTMDTTTIERALLPRFNAAGLTVESLEAKNAYMAGSIWDSGHLSTSSWAGSRMVGSSMVGLVAERLNMQRTDISDSDVSGIQLTHPSSEEGRLLRLTSDEATSVTDWQLADATHDNSLRPNMLKGTPNMGPGAAARGNLRASGRREAAVTIAAADQLGA